ncbi:DUF6894 family protein [Tsuneonella sp. HG249]
MPRYFMHLRDGHEEVLDPEGVEASSATVAGLALAAARDCMAHDVQSGRLNFAYRIDVHDAAGKLVHSIAFRDAVAITES